jgi:hypothetical protein
MNKNTIAVKLILADLTNAHKYFEQTMEGVTNEVAHFKPAGTANPIAGVYAHLIFSEDFFLHTFLKKTQPLFDSTWKDKTGISSLQPTEWVTEYPKWLKEVKITIPQVYEYAKAVFTETEKYIESLDDNDLEELVDMSMFGMGSRTRGDMIHMMILGHVWSIMGEISVLKGIQGLKGYPF